MSRQNDTPGRFTKGLQPRDDASAYAEFNRQTERLILSGQVLGQERRPRWDTAGASRSADQRDLAFPDVAHHARRRSHDLLASLGGTLIVTLVAHHDDRGEGTA